MALGMGEKNRKNEYTKEYTQEELEKARIERINEAIEKEAKEIALKNKITSDIEVISNVFKCTLDEAKMLLAMVTEEITNNDFLDIIFNKEAVYYLIALKQKNTNFFFCEYTEVERKQCIGIDKEGNPIHEIIPSKVIKYVTTDEDMRDEADNFYILEEK